MKNIKSENGAITILVLVSVLFMLSFLISSYVIIANKVQTQKEIIAQTRKVYGNYDLDEIYNSYFSNGEVVPIYDTNQLFKLGTNVNSAIKQMENKIYKFSNTGKYILMEDLEIDESELPEGWIAPELFFMRKNNKLGKIDYNGHTIKVKYSNGEEIIYDGTPIMILNVAEGAIEIKNDTYKITTTNEDGTTTTTEDEYTGKYVITGTSDKNTVKILGTGNFDITLRNLNIDVSKIGYAVAFNGNYNIIAKGVNVKIKLEGENTLIGGGSAPGLGFAGAIANIDGEIDGSTLTIEGDGILNVKGGDYAGGIGSGYGYWYAANGAANNIIINSGTIIARTGNNGDAIGPGLRNQANNIVINGGNITAIGSNSNGIGGTGTIINGGVITASGGEYGYGIKADGLIINGGIITSKATCKTRTGIGTNEGAEVTINGGTVIAQASSHNQMPGIGTGSYTTDEATEEQLATIKVVVNGGSVLATGNVDIGYGVTKAYAKNSNGETIYLTKIKLNNITSATKIEAITTSDNIEYKTNDMYTGTEGDLYLYIPEGTRTINIETADKTYSAQIVTSKDNEQTVNTLD